jgi:hypothetical protein
MRLELTPAERVLLANQFRILEALYYSEKADSSKRHREILEGGYSMHYSDFAPWLDREMNDAECNEVYDILSMFSNLFNSYQSLKGKSGIEGPPNKFWGFDRNTETNYYGFANYLINTCGQFAELKDSGDRLNSHGPYLPVYRRMLVQWRPVKKPQLTKEEIKAICAAAIHPENRE